MNQHLFSRARKTNLYNITIVIILCTLSYHIGCYQYFLGSIPGAGAATSLLPCIPSPVNTTTAVITTSLDFSAHHYGPYPPQTVAREFQIPPCDASYVEYTPCEDVQRSLKFDRERLIYGERHCPENSEVLKCRVPAPYGYKVPFRWPESRGSAWYANVPHKELTVERRRIRTGSVSHPNIVKRGNKRIK